MFVCGISPLPPTLFKQCTWEFCGPTHAAGEKRTAHLAHLAHLAYKFIAGLDKIRYDEGTK